MKKRTGNPKTAHQKSQSKQNHRASDTAALQQP